MTCRFVAALSVHKSQIHRRLGGGCSGKGGLVQRRQPDGGAKQCGTSRWWHTRNVHFVERALHFVAADRQALQCRSCHVHRAESNGNSRRMRRWRITRGFGPHAPLRFAYNWIAWRSVAQNRVVRRRRILRLLPFDSARWTWHERNCSLVVQQLRSVLCLFQEVYIACVSLYIIEVPHCFVTPPPPLDRPPLQEHPQSSTIESMVDLCTDKAASNLIILFVYYVLYYYYCHYAAVVTVRRFQCVRYLWLLSFI